MADEQATVEPQADEAEQAPYSAGSPISGLAEALTPMVLAASRGRETPAEEPAGATSTGESAADPAASKPGDAPESSDQASDEQPADQPSTESQPARPSRRAQADEERRAEIRAVVEERERETAARIAAEQQLAAQQAQQNAVHTEAIEQLGDEAEYTRLMTMRMGVPKAGQPREYLTADEDDKLDGMISARKMAKSYYELATRQVHENVYAVLQSEAKQIGLELDPATFAAKPPFATFLQSDRQATEARVRGELEPQLTAEREKNADLEAENEALRSRNVANTRQPVAANGRSGASVVRDGQYIQEHTPQQNIADYFRARIPGA